MTLLHLHHDDPRGLCRDNPLSISPLSISPRSISRIFRRIAAAFRIFHRAIVSAKLRYPHGEPLFRHDYSELLPPEQDATKFPQRPLVLGDKWDF